MDKRNIKKTIIELEQVWKIYCPGTDHCVNALRDISIKIAIGEFVAIKGPSGSGKSTLVNMVGCLDVPTRGRILLDGRDISKMSESELAQVRGRKIGFVFQSFNLVQTLTSMENVTLPMMFQNMDKAKRERRALELMNIVGIAHRTTHKPTEMSGGEQQRVAIARSLANDPEVILADEPTGNLDSKTGQAIMDFLQKLHKEGKTIIMVTHDDRLAKYAERIIYIKDGELVKSL